MSVMYTVPVQSFTNTLTVIFATLPYWGLTSAMHMGKNLP